MVFDVVVILCYNGYPSEDATIIMHVKVSRDEKLGFRNINLQ